MPRVTALMPFFRGAAFLEETLRSVQTQTFCDWECLVVSEPDAEPAGLDILARMADDDSRIVCVVNKERLGIAASLNIGIDMARGEYIARVDADDPCEQERFALQIAFMDAHPDITVCGTSTYTENGTNRSILVNPLEDADIKAALLFGCEFSHCSVMLRKETWDEHGWRYDPAVVTEDYDLWIRMLPKARFANLIRPLVTHRWGVNNTSLIVREAMFQAMIDTSARAIREYLGVDTGAYDPKLFLGWRSRPEDYAKNRRTVFLREGFALLEEIAANNDRTGFFDSSVLKAVLWRKWSWICQSCGLQFREKLPRPQNRADAASPPVVSIVLPVCNGMTYLRESIDSLLAQTYNDWELLAVNEYGSDDGSAEIVRFYAHYDNRITLLQNTEPLGLAASLNRGIKSARGRYIARMDADDIALPMRLRKQVAFLDSHPRIGICGSYQEHFGNKSSIHKPPITPEQCRANLLFFCDACHSTMMFRKDIFVKNNLWYDSAYLSEDFELWSRAIGITEFTTIPEVLGRYRVSDQNTTIPKRSRIEWQNAEIVGNSLRRYFGIVLTEEEQATLRFCGSQDAPLELTEQEFGILRGILSAVWSANAHARFCTPWALRRVLNAKWQWALHGKSMFKPRPVYPMSMLFAPETWGTRKGRFLCFWLSQPTILNGFLTIGLYLWRQAVRPWRAVDRKDLEAFFNKMNPKTMQGISSSVEKWSWERFQRVRSRFDGVDNRLAEIQGSMADVQFRHYRRLCLEGEPIRLVFWFSIPSFWPALEAFYEACLNDPRFSVTVVCCDAALDASVNIDGARDFLASRNIPYVPYRDFSLDVADPHVFVVQTPYDGNRPKRYSGMMLKSRGIRVIYMGYGFEIAGTEAGIEDHFRKPFFRYAWRIYTFSPKMLPDYSTHCENSPAVRALGTPRLDSLFHRERFPPDPKIFRLAAGRPVILFKVHFPKEVVEKGKKWQVTPYIRDYLEFLDHLPAFDDMFFVFMPHPRFLEFNMGNALHGQAEALMGKARSLGRNRLYVDDRDDYRPVLFNAEAVIIDRSAIMVEAGALGVPVLYMTNPDFTEPLSEAVAPIVGSFCQGSRCKDMLTFLTAIRAGKDPEREKRLAAWRENVPHFDGKCSDRIKEDIVNGIRLENLDIFNATLPSVAAENGFPGHGKRDFS